MASGYASQGVDFDDLFDPFVQGPKSQDCGYASLGIDLSNRYAPIVYGSKRADVGYARQGVDVSNLWAAKGTARYTLPFNGKVVNGNSTAPTNATGMAQAGGTLLLQPDGGYRVERQGNFGSDYLLIESGVWIPNGQSVSEYEVMFSNSNPGEASISNGAPSFVPISTARSISVVLSTPAQRGPLKNASVELYANMRRNGIVQRSFITVNMSVLGYE